MVRVVDRPRSIPEFAQEDGGIRELPRVAGNAGRSPIREPLPVEEGVRTSVR